MNHGGFYYQGGLLEQPVLPVITGASFLKFAAGAAILMWIFGRNWK